LKSEDVETVNDVEEVEQVVAGKHWKCWLPVTKRSDWVLLPLRSRVLSAQPHKMTKIIVFQSLTQQVQLPLSLNWKKL
jgi:hypothetical protein